MPYGECLFFDVGQGAANIILLENRRALILDTGPLKDGPVHQFLEDYLVESIECVILSHNDRDHIGGWERLATRFGEKIKNVYLLKDRPFKTGATFDLTMALARQGVIPRPQRAEVRDLRKPLTIWQDRRRSMRLDLLYPDMIANDDADRGRDPNRTSAIVALSCHARTILFPGDSTLDAWKTLKENSESLPIKVEILALPHHGGLIKKNTAKSDVEWLFDECIDCRVATVSVGSHNRYGHPRSEILEVLRAKGVVVMCTQITPQCHQGRPLVELSPGVIPPEEHSLSARPGGRGIACAGTVVATLSSDGIEVQREQEHQSAVGYRLRSPMCV